MSEQLILDLPVKTAFGRDNFFVSGANAQAVAMLQNWRDWPLGKLVLTGPPGAGKTHLTRIWASESGADAIAAVRLAGADIPALARTGAAIEDVPAASADGQTALFHLHNLCAEAGTPLLLTGRGPAAGWAIELPDLQSRIAAAMEVQLGPPDDTLLQALLIKHFSDRQVQVSPRVLRQLLTRMDRSFAFAERLVDKLDTVALAQGAAISPRLAGQVLAELAQETE